MGAPAERRPGARVHCSRWADSAHHCCCCLEHLASGMGQRRSHSLALLGCSKPLDLPVSCSAAAEDLAACLDPLVHSVPPVALRLDWHSGQPGWQTQVAAATAVLMMPVQHRAALQHASMLAVQRLTDDAASTLHAWVGVHSRLVGDPGHRAGHSLARGAGVLALAEQAAGADLLLWGQAQVAQYAL